MFFSCFITFKHLSSALRKVARTVTAVYCSSPATVTLLTRIIRLFYNRIICTPQSDSVTSLQVSVSLEGSSLSNDQLTTAQQVVVDQNLI